MWLVSFKIVLIFSVDTPFFSKFWNPFWKLFQRTVHTLFFILFIFLKNSLNLLHWLKIVCFRLWKQMNSLLLCWLYSVYVIYIIFLLFLFCRCHLIYQLVLQIMWHLNSSLWSQQNQPNVMVLRSIGGLLVFVLMRCSMATHHSQELITLNREHTTKSWTIR